MTITAESSATESTDRTPVIIRRSCTFELDIPDNPHVVPWQYFKPAGHKIRVTHLTCTWFVEPRNRGLKVSTRGPRILSNGTEGDDLNGTLSSDDIPEWVRDIVDPIAPRWY